MWCRTALRVLVLVLAGGAAVHAAPIQNPGETLTPALIERGCTVDLMPWRAECHVVKNENTTLKHVGDDPASDPLFDVGCDWNEGAKIPHHCHIGDFEFENPLPDIIDWLRGFPYHDEHHPEEPKHPPTPVPTIPVPTSPPTTTTSPVPTTTRSPLPTSPPTTTTSPLPTSPPTPTPTEKPKNPSPTATSSPPTAPPTQDPDKNMTDVVDALHSKDKKALKIGLGVGCKLLKYMTLTVPRRHICRYLRSVSPPRSPRIILTTVTSMANSSFCSGCWYPRRWCSRMDRKGFKHGWFRNRPLHEGTR